jgi:hypothetical protein
MYPQHQQFLHRIGLEHAAFLEQEGFCRVSCFEHMQIGATQGETLHILKAATRKPISQSRQLIAVKTLYSTILFPLQLKTIAVSE